MARPTIHLEGDDGHLAGWLVRIQGLAKATELNGQVAIVGSISANGRYEVELVDTSEKKSVQPQHLQQLPLMDEVTLWIQFFQKVNEVTSDDLVLQRLERLEEIQMTVEVLVQTKALIGMLAQHQLLEISGFFRANKDQFQDQS